MSARDRWMHRGLITGAQGAVDAVSNRSLVIKTANWLKFIMTLPKRMAVAQCFVLDTVTDVWSDASVNALRF